jgi:aspartate ammonia-lyase
VNWIKPYAAAFFALCAVGSVIAQEKPRTERDLLGEKKVPADAYYGVQTARALENFQISGIEINHYPGFVEAWAIVKLAAAKANTDVGAINLPALQPGSSIMPGKVNPVVPEVMISLPSASWRMISPLTSVLILANSN